MKAPEKQDLFRRYAHQTEDEHKARIKEETKELDKALQRFDTNTQISILREKLGAFVELDNVSRGRHSGILVASQISGKEHETHTEILTQQAGFEEQSPFAQPETPDAPDEAERAGSPPEHYYRSQVSIHPADQNYQLGVANYNHGTSTHDFPRPTTGQSLSLQSSSLQSSPYRNSNNVTVGLRLSTFVSESEGISTEDYLRHQFNIPPYQAVDLRALPDPPTGQRPSQPLPVLIKLAIHGSPKKKLTLREIYLSLEERFVWFRENRGDRAWKESIRYNLSLNTIFRCVQRPITEPGEGLYWVLDITRGDGYHRKRIRKKLSNSNEKSSPGVAFFSHSSDVHIDSSRFEAAGRDIVTYMSTYTDNGHKNEVLLAGNFITSLFGTHVMNTYHSRRLKLSSDTMTHPLSLVNTRFHVIYEAPLLTFSIWAFILYALKYGGRMRNQ